MIATRNVDVLIGGQWGSEGKGNIVSKIAPAYDILVRTGGPNAGHQVVWGEPAKKFTFRHLPSGALHAPKARLILGPGAVIYPDVLYQEMQDAGIADSRLVIDPQAVIITDRMREAEPIQFRHIGSTAQGVGQATMSKILRTTRDCILASHYSSLHRFVRPTLPLLQNSTDRILVEGTQGALLSLHHGDWPYVTSRDTTTSGMLSEAGIPPTRVNRVVMVIRTFPIRVQSPEGGTSGPMGRETTWESVASISGNRYTGDELRQREMTTTTKRQRRVAEFDLDYFIRAHQLCGPTDLAVTFADYIHAANFPTFLRHIGFKCSTPVSLISSGPAPSDVEWKNESLW